MYNSKLEDSEFILNADGSVYHLHIKEEDIADTIILVGDQQCDAVLLHAINEQK